jgi:RNA polymerase sigma factor (sigma-70 family)
MDEARDRTRDERFERALEFAQQKLGPATAALIESCAGAEALGLGLQSCGDEKDALLTVAFRAMQAEAGNSMVGNEFWGYFLSLLSDQPHQLQSHYLRRIHGSSDLVQSAVLGLWCSSSHLEFHSRAAFLSLLIKRLTWKAQDHGKRLTRDRRREDLRIDAPPEDWNDQSDDPSEIEKLISAEDRDQVVLKMSQLPAHDQLVLHHILEGKGTDELAEKLEITFDAARKRKNRVIRRLIDLF